MEKDESLLDAAQRALALNGGKNIELYCASQAPIAVQLTYDDADGFFGSKTFFVKVQYDDGEIAKQDEFAWLNRAEIVDEMIRSGGDEEAKFYHYVL